MEIEIITNNGKHIAEITSKEIIINSAEDGLNLLGNIYYQGADSLIIDEHLICKEFFDLKTGMAGEILQKFSTYKVRLAIVGDFTKYESKSLQDFIKESNKYGHVNFVETRDEAIEKLNK